MTTAMIGGLLVLFFAAGVGAWTGEIHGRVVCDVCGDSSIGPEDHVLEETCLSSSERCLQLQNGSMFLAGAEVAVLCITKSGEVLNYQAFTNSKGAYIVAETMPESDRWDACLARPMSSFHEHCTQRGDAHSGIKFTYDLPSGYSHTVKPFLYKPISAPAYCF